MSNHGAAREVLTRARQALNAPLSTLQLLPSASPVLVQATEFVASASSALYDAQSELDQPGRDEQTTRSIRRSTEALGKALELVETLVATENAVLAGVSESLARALALLYPLAQARLRQRRAVMLSDAVEPDAPLAFIPHAPKSRPSDTLPADKPPAKPNRRGTPRAMLEVDVGLLSHSHFYTGLSMDLSKGGLFVATSEPLPVGTLLTLFFILPTGAVVEAPGTVRWSRSEQPDLPAGMGVAFEELGADARRAIATFCQWRTPFVHDSADD